MTQENIGDMKGIDISIVVITRNRALMLKMALESLRIQAIDDKFVYEILVVDDGSTDDTAKIVQKVINLADNNAVSLKYIYQGKSGRSSARNKGVRGASAADG